MHVCVEILKTNMEEDVHPCTSNIEQEKCEKSKCIEDEDTKKLNCKMCKRKVHYKCSQLPLYEILRYTQFHKYPIPYVCANCVDIPESVKSNINWCDYVDYKEKYKREQQQSNELRESLRQLNEKMQKMENELAAVKLEQATNNKNISEGKSKQKKRKINEGNAGDDAGLIAAIEQYDEGVNKEIEILKKQNENLSERLEEREKALDDTLQQLQNAEDPLIKQIENTFNERFNSMQTILMKSIDEKINKNLNLGKSNKPSYASTAADVNNESISANSKPQQVPNTQSFRSFMMATRNEELAEERDKKERMCNIIIHGLGKIFNL